MRKLLVLALAAGASAVLAAIALAATKSVKVGDNYYVRPSGVPKVTVSKGTTVKWRFGSGSPAQRHRQSRARRSSTPACSSSGTYTKKIKKRGTYTIFCTIHGAATRR